VLQSFRSGNEVNSMTNDLLQVELETYAREKDQLLAKHENEFVLIHNADVLGVFESGQDALRVGCQTIGNRPFLVKKIERFEHVVRLSSNLIAI
jgi:hypothetical protein